MKQRLVVMAFVCALGALVPDLALAAVNGYVRLGDVKGEATDQDHTDWILIESMEAPIRTKAATTATGKAGSGRFSIKHVANVKVSPAVLRLILSKTTLSVPLDVMEGGKLNHFVFTGCRVNSYSLKYSSSDTSSLEDITFVYDAVQWTK